MAPSSLLVTPELSQSWLGIAVATGVGGTCVEKLPRGAAVWRSSLCRGPGGGPGCGRTWWASCSAELRPRGGVGGGGQRGHGRCRSLRPAEDAAWLGCWWRVGADIVGGSGPCSGPSASWFWKSPEGLGRGRVRAERQAAVSGTSAPGQKVVAGGGGGCWRPHQAPGVSGRWDPGHVGRQPHSQGQRARGHGERVLPPKSTLPQLKLPSCWPSEGGGRGARAGSLLLCSSRGDLGRVRHPH